MNGDAKSKLTEVLERREREKAAAAIGQLAREAASSEKETHREAIRLRWVLAKDEIGAAVDAVNAEIAPTGMVLSWSEKPRGDDHAGLAQLFINLAEEGDPRERRVVFNVSALGLVQPVTLIPHTGRKIPDFKIDDVNKDHYEGVIVDFIDQCVSKKR
jgi:hypothetical protein